jgi:RNA polymerase sigma factor (sigma-70 family)
MQEQNDNDLLREYVEHDSEEAFAALVTRHIDKVYSVALRRTGNPHHAEEITQAVFVILARKSRKLGRRVILSGWLYQTARLTAVTFIRGEIRRARREQEAHMQTILNEDESDAWTHIAPLLDSAMAGLNETDHHAVVLRFFDGKSLRDVGAALGTNEDAARMRVDRALEKLRLFFVKRGVSSTTAIIAGVISANSVQAAPVALAKFVTAAAVVKGAAASGSTPTLIKGALKLMAWTKAKTAVVSGVTVLLMAGVVTETVKAIHAHRTQPNIQGDWEGVVELQGTQSRVVLHITATNGSYRATEDGIDSRLKGIPVVKFVYDYPAVEFEVKDASRGIDGAYTGKLNASATEMSGIGTNKVVGREVPLVLKWTASPDPVPELLAESDYAPQAGSDLQGYWKGTVQAGPVKLRVAFKIAEPAEGKFAAEMDCPDAGANNLVVSSVTYDKPKVRMDVGLLGVVFQGKLSSDGTKIAGTWTQARVPLALTVERADPKAEQAKQAAAAAQEAEKDYSHTGPNDLTGHWKGVLDIKGSKGALTLHIAKLPNGELSASLGTIKQGANNIPADAVSFTAPNAHMEWNNLGVTYDGKVQNGKITGEWKMRGLIVPLVFARSQTQ